MALTPTPKNKPGCLGLLALAAVAAQSAPSAVRARANVVYSQYEGAAAVLTGQGGTRITENGIDYWTSGTPPRRYQVIGMIADKREEGGVNGHAIGSDKIASKVKKAGGDAVIIQSQNEAGGGGGGGFGNVFALRGSKTITEMLVIRYLPDDAAPTPGGTPIH